MSKKEMISIRILPQQKEICKQLNLTYSQIWDAGFQDLVPKKKEELKNLAQKHHDLYIQYKQMYIQFDEENKENVTKLDENCNIYIQNRSIENPETMDINWIKARIKKHKLGVSVESFLARCKELKSGVDG